METSEGARATWWARTVLETSNALDGVYTTSWGFKSLHTTQRGFGWGPYRVKDSSTPRIRKAWQVCTPHHTGVPKTLELWRPFCTTPGAQKALDGAGVLSMPAQFLGPV